MIYKATKGSREYLLEVDITDVDTEITLDSVVGLEAPGVLTLGEGLESETIGYTTIEGNVLKGVKRGIGIADGKIINSGAYSWAKGTKIRRLFTDYDYNVLRAFVLGELELYEEVERDGEGRIIKVIEYVDENKSKKHKQENYTYDKDKIIKHETIYFDLDGVNVVSKTIEVFLYDGDVYKGSRRVVL